MRATGDWLARVAIPPGFPPGPRRPLALQTLRYGFDPYGLFESAHRAFGDVFTARAMGETWVVLAHPEAVRELYTHGAAEVDSGAANRALRPLLGTQNVLLLDGDEHLRRRKLVLPPFHGERMGVYDALIRDATRRQIAAWPLGTAAPTLPRMHAITLQVVLRAVFGVDEGPRLDRLGALLRRLVTWTTDTRRALLYAFLGPDRLMGLRGFRRQMVELDAAIADEIGRRRVRPVRGTDGDRRDRARARAPTRWPTTTPRRAARHRHRAGARRPGHRRLVGLRHDGGAGDAAQAADPAGSAARQIAHDRPEHRHQVARDAVERHVVVLDRPERDGFGGADEDVGDGVELLGIRLALPA